MSRILVLFAHPLPRKSVTTRDLLTVFNARPDVTARSLYDLYPDYDIDVAAEQRAVEQAEVVVLLAPVTWYSVPAMLKHWFDVVLTHGWAHGHSGKAVEGKALWWVASSGADRSAYTPQGSHLQSFDDFAAPLEYMARYCGMRWLPPFVVYTGLRASAEQKQATRLALSSRCDEFLGTRSPA